MTSFSFLFYTKGMFYSVTGTLKEIREQFVVLEAGGLGLRVFVSGRTRAALPSPPHALTLYCHLHVKEDALDLFGFLSPEELSFFELLISVSGVGPKSALSIMDVAELKNLASAIKEARPDLLTKASGIGHKTAERIILELRSKVKVALSGEAVKQMESDHDLVETLTSLGYRREEAKAALTGIGDTVKTLEERLKAALKVLGRKTG